MPILGLSGAVLATAAANAAALTLVYFAGRMHGMHLQPGTLAISAVPALFWLGPWATLLALAAIATASLSSNWVLTEYDRRRLLGVGHEYLARARSALKWRQTARA